MPGVIGSLAVSVVARTQKFVQDMKRAGGSVRGMANDARGAGSSITSALGPMSKMIGPAGLAGLAYGAIKTADAFTTLSAEQKRFYDNIGKTSTKLGIQAEKLQQLGYAGEMTGVEQKTLNMALQRMTRRVAEAAQGTGEAKDALAELNLNAARLNALSPDKQFAAIAQAFSSVESQSDRVRLAFKLFDSEGVALVNTLALGVDGLNEMAQSATQTGSVLSGDAVKDIEKLNDASARFGKAWDGILLQSRSAFSGWWADITNDFARDLEHLQGQVFGYKDATDQNIASQQELNRVFDAQAKRLAELAKKEEERRKEAKKEYDEKVRAWEQERARMEEELARTRTGQGTIGASPEQQRIAQLEELMRTRSGFDDIAKPLIEELKVTERLRLENEKIAEAKREAQRVDDEMRSDADALLESIKSDEQRMRDEVARIQQLKDRGLISGEEQLTAIDKMRRELGAGPETNRMAGALLAGSQEARAASMRTNDMRNHGPVAETAKNTAAMRDYLERIVESIENDQLLAGAADDGGLATKEWG